MSAITLEALIVDPNPINRGYLWQATLAHSSFTMVKAHSKLDAALRFLAETKFDVVLVTSAFSKDEIKEFVQTAKTTSGGKEAAYVCVMRRQDQTTDNLAFGLIDGTDGFLLEPYSADSLHNVACIAVKVKKEFERKRKRAAITLILKEVMKRLDEYAFAQYSRKETREAKVGLMKEARNLKKCADEEMKAIYHEVALELFETAPPRPSTSLRANRVGNLIKEMQEAKQREK